MPSTNKEQEMLPAKLKGEKKIAQEGIQNDNVTYVQRGHWESSLLLLTCIFQQCHYKFKSIFYK